MNSGKLTRCPACLPARLPAFLPSCMHACISACREKEHALNHVFWPCPVWRQIRPGSTMQGRARGEIEASAVPAGSSRWHSQQCLATPPHRHWLAAGHCRPRSSHDLCHVLGRQLQLPLLGMCQRICGRPGSRGMQRLAQHGAVAFRLRHNPWHVRRVGAGCVWYASESRKAGRHRVGAIAGSLLSNPMLAPPVRAGG